MIAQREWTPTQAEFDLFARLSGDDNPIHVDPAFSARSRFGRTVSHGMLIYARLWVMVREARPTQRMVVQEMMFPDPAFAGEALLLSLTGARTDQGGALVMTATRAADGAVCFSGKAVLA